MKRAWTFFWANSWRIEGSKGCFDHFFLFYSEGINRSGGGGCHFHQKNVDDPVARSRQTNHILAASKLDGTWVGGGELCLIKKKKSNIVWMWSSMSNTNSGFSLPFLFLSFFFVFNLSSLRLTFLFRWGRLFCVCLLYWVVEIKRRNLYSWLSLWLFYLFFLPTLGVYFFFAFVLWVPLPAGGGRGIRLLLFFFFIFICYSLNSFRNEWELKQGKTVNNLYRYSRYLNSIYIFYDYHPIKLYFNT